MKKNRRGPLDPSPRTRIKSLRTPKQQIKNGDWHRYNYPEQCKFIQKWDCRTLVLQNNRTYTLLDSIKHINLGRLKRLLLPNNRIETIEGICDLWLPCLELLNLSNNCISSVRALGRACFSNLMSLHIEANPIHDASCELAKALMPRMKELSLDYYSYQKPTFQDISAIAKLQSSRIEELYFDSSSRIIQRNAISILIHRYPDAEIAQQLLMDNEQNNESEMSEQEEVDITWKQPNL